MCYPSWKDYWWKPVITDNSITKIHSWAMPSEIRIQNNMWLIRILVTWKIIEMTFVLKKNYRFLIISYFNKNKFFMNKCSLKNISHDQKHTEQNVLLIRLTLIKEWSSYNGLWKDNHFMIRVLWRYNCIINDIEWSGFSEFYLFLETARRILISSLGNNDFHEVS